MSSTDPFSNYSTLRPAHSGPELASYVPQPGLARELAQALLTDRFELARFETQPLSTSASCAGSMMVGLARR